MKKNKILIGIFVSMLLIILVKSITFTYVLSCEVDTIAKGIDKKLIFLYIGFVLGTISVMFFIKGKWQVKYLLIVDILFSAYLVFQFRYYIATGYLGGISLFVLPYMYDPISNINFNFRFIDLVWFIDLFVFGLIYVLYKEKIKGIIYNFERKILNGVISILISLILIGGTYLAVKNINNEKDGTFFENYNHPVVTMKATSPLGYLYFDLKMVYDAKIKKTNQRDKDRIEKWLEWNKEELQDNGYKGILKDKNLIFIQVESLENIVINQKVNGEEITPNINKLANEGLYFSNIYEQNAAGNTADCDFMSNTSIFPRRDRITFLSNSYKTYNSLPVIMKEKGYYNVAGHPEAASDYYWKQNYFSLGFDQIYDKKELNLKEKVGYLCSDEEFVEKYSQKLKDIDKPFFSMMTTITSHGPFYMPEDKKYMNLSKELNENRLGEYFQSINYTDKQVGKFIDNLDSMGILEDSVVVIFGDHCGPYKYYPDMIKDAPLEEDWWKTDKYQVPFIVYSNGLEKAVIDKNGGQVDIMPTVLYLLGIESEQLMGRNLLNTNRNSTVFIKKRDGKAELQIIGNPTKEEEQKLKEAYEIGELIINN